MVSEKNLKLKTKSAATESRKMKLNEHLKQHDFCQRRDEIRIEFQQMDFQQIDVRWCETAKGFSSNKPAFILQSRFPRLPLCLLLIPIILLILSSSFFLLLHTVLPSSSREEEEEVGAPSGGVRRLFCPSVSLSGRVGGPGDVT